MKKIIFVLALLGCALVYLQQQSYAEKIAHKEYAKMELKECNACHKAEGIALNHDTDFVRGHRVLASEDGTRCAEARVGHPGPREGRHRDAAVAVPRAVAHDLEAGAPELRASSRYNRDDAFFAARYGTSNDVFAAFVRTPREGCLAWRTLVDADRLEWSLQQLPSVRATASLAGAARRITAGSFEGNPKWLTISRDQAVLNYAAQQAMTANPELVNAECPVLPVIAHLADHRADTLDEVVRVAEAFARRHGDADRTFLLAAGNAGIQAAQNEVVRDARWTMTLCAYAVVALLCLAAFRSWRAVVVTMVPLACTGVACGALMASLGIGMKLATLPVIALGVGIPDFALYLLSIQLAHQRAGVPLEEAYRRALRFTGKVVVLVSVTLAAGVVTWAFSPLKLQADMGVLLTFMFIGNMVAALVLVPALSRLLLQGAGDGREAALA